MKFFFQSFKYNMAHLLVDHDVKFQKAGSMIKQKKFSEFMTTVVHEYMPKMT